MSWGLLYRGPEWRLELAGSEGCSPRGAWRDPIDVLGRSGGGPRARPFMRTPSTSGLPCAARSTKVLPPGDHRGVDQTVPTANRHVHRRGGDGSTAGGSTRRRRSVRLRALADSGRNPPEREPFLSRLTDRNSVVVGKNVASGSQNF